MELRYYQREAVDAATHWFNTQDTHPLIVLPTGAGKTVVFATLIKEIFEREPDCRILILAHRQELVSQAEDKLKKALKSTDGNPQLVNNVKNNIKKAIEDENFKRDKEKSFNRFAL